MESYEVSFGVDDEGKITRLRVDEGFRCGDVASFGCYPVEDQLQIGICIEEDCSAHFGWGEHVALDEGAGHFAAGRVCGEKGHVAACHLTGYHLNFQNALVKISRTLNVVNRYLEIV